MKPIQSFNAASLLLDFGHTSLRALDGGRRLEVPLERGTDGRLTAPAKEELIRALREFLGNRWRPRRRAVCAIGARGLSLRHLSLPVSPNKNLGEILTLQVERELPVAPSELAWGYRRTEAAPPAAAAAGEQHLLLAAVRRDLVEEYAAILGDCRLIPVFTPGILNLLPLCPNPPASFAVLDIGRRQCELLACRDGTATTLRVLPFGGDSITARLAEALGIPEDKAAQVKLRWSRGLPGDASEDAAIERAVRGAFAELASLIASTWVGERIYLAGKSALIENAARWLSDGFGSSTGCQVIEPPSSTGSSALLEGLKIDTAAGRRTPSLRLELPGAEKRQTAATAAGVRMWGAAAVLLALASLSFRYTEPLIRAPGLERKLAEASLERAEGPELDHELSFLQHIHSQRGPYLMVLETLSEAAPNGARFESLSMNRRDQVSFETTLRGADQAIDLRSKLIASGVFSSVVVEEQRPSPQNNNELLVRITARSRPAAEIRIPE